MLDRSNLCLLDGKAAEKHQNWGVFHTKSLPCISFANTKKNEAKLKAFPPPRWKSVMLIEPRPFPCIPTIRTQNICVEDEKTQVSGVPRP